MRLTSSYGMKLTGDLKALEESIMLYREALRTLIPIINDGWDTLSEYTFTKQKYNCIENYYLLVLESLCLAWFCRKAKIILKSFVFI